MQMNTKDLGAGGLFLAIGLFFTLNAWFGLPIGNGYPIGPGFFPAALGIILCCFGIGIAVSGLRKPRSASSDVPWRGLVLVFGSVLFFAVTIDALGILPALGGSTLLAALAPNDARWKEALLTTLGLTVFCVAVFIYGLRLPYPIVAPWILGG